MDFDEMEVETETPSEYEEEPREERREELLAHSYVPWQYYESAFSPKEALMKGTLFPELYGVYPIPE